jgi:hypothetical protein
VEEAARKVERYMAEQGLVSFGGLSLRKDAEAGKRLAHAVIDLVNCRGRYHTEQNFEKLKAELKYYLSRVTK